MAHSTGRSAESMKSSSPKSQQAERQDPPSTLPFQRKPREVFFLSALVNHTTARLLGSHSELQSSADTV